MHNNSRQTYLALSASFVSIKIWLNIIQQHKYVVCLFFGMSGGGGGGVNVWGKLMIILNLPPELKEFE